MESLTWVVLTGAIVWLALGGYITFVALRQKQLRQRLEQLELLHHDQ